jgi:hypothetical protein
VRWLAGTVSSPRVQILNTDLELWALRAPFTDEYRQLHRYAMQAYVAGEWPAARRHLEAAAYQLWQQGSVQQLGHAADTRAASTRGGASGAAADATAGAAASAAAVGDAGDGTSVAMGPSVVGSSAPAERRMAAVPRPSGGQSAYTFVVADLDAPSQQVYSFMAQHAFAAPAGWRGFRPGP